MQTEKQKKAAWLQAAIMYLLPVSQTMACTHLRHLDTEANQNLTHTWGSPGKVPQLASSVLGAKAIISMVLEPPAWDVLETKRHIQRVSHTSSRWHEEKSRYLMSAAQFQEPFQDSTKRYGSWVSTVKQVHKSTTVTQHAGLLWKAAWGLGDFIQLFAVILKKLY